MKNITCFSDMKFSFFSFEKNSCVLHGQVFVMNTKNFSSVSHFDLFHYRLWLCTFTLAVSAGAVLLLPISIISNEVLLAYPNSYYVKWLNSSLIHGEYTTLPNYEYPQSMFWSKKKKKPK